MELDLSIRPTILLSLSRTWRQWRGLSSHILHAQVTSSLARKLAELAESAQRLHCKIRRLLGSILSCRLHNHRRTIQS